MPGLISRILLPLLFATLACGRPSVSLSAAADAAALNQAGLAAYQIAGYESALANFEAASAKDPTNAEYPNNAGITRLRLGKAERAVIDFERAINLNGDAGMYPFNKGLALLQAGKKDAAIAAFERTVAVQADHYDGWLYLGRLYFADLRYDDAISAWNTAAGLRESAEVQTSLGSAELARNDYASAEGHFLRAIELEPANALAFYNLGLLRQTQHKLEPAVENYRKAIQLNVNQFEAYLNLGIVQEQLGKRTEAIQTLEEFIRRAPPKSHMQQIVAARVRINALRAPR